MTKFKGKTINWIEYYARKGTLRLPGEKAISPKVYQDREREKFAQLVEAQKDPDSSLVYRTEMAKLRKLVGLPTIVLEDDSR